MSFVDGAHGRHEGEGSVRTLLAAKLEDSRSHFCNALDDQHGVRP